MLSTAKTAEAHWVRKYRNKTKGETPGYLCLAPPLPLHAVPGRRSLLLAAVLFGGLDQDVALRVAQAIHAVLADLLQDFIDPFRGTRLVITRNELADDRLA